MDKRIFAAVLAAVAAAGSAQAMDVATFLAKGEALRQKGMMAMFSSESGEIQRELQSAVASLRRERLAARSAGRRAAYCPPDHASLDIPEILAAMRAVPPARRSHTEVKDALRAAFARKYPCAQ